VLGREDLIGVDAATYLADHDALAPHTETIVDATEETTFEVTVGDRHYDVRVTPLFDHRDELVGRQVQLHEVTEQRRRERELERQNERLDRFASVLSHDLRNPLNVATGRTELVRETGEVRHAEDVEQALDRIESIIDEMLTLTREGQAVESVEPVPLETVASAAWETVDTGAGRLTVETSHRIEADRERTVRLFENLFRNSVEHAGPDVTVTVGELDDGFYVADDGPGIPPEDRERVLEYGYTSDTEGTGLGLSIVTSIADAHGWTVTVTESERGGARFEFRGVDVVSVSAVSETAGD
jgi:signal transduction histidine kinase